LFLFCILVFIALVQAIAEGANAAAQFAGNFADASYAKAE